MNTASDTVLWNNIKQGNTLAFQVLYERYIDDLILFGKKLGADCDIIQDTLQQLFLYLWESKTRMSIPDNTKAYLMKSFRNNLLRAIKEEKLISSIDIEHHLRDIPGVVSAKSDVDEIKRLQIAMKDLSARQREVLHLRFYQGIKNQEISEIMGISYQSVCNLLQRAIQAMRLHVNKD